MAYLDNSATSPPFEHVIERMAACMRGGFYNPASLYGPAVGVLEEMDACRQRLLLSCGMHDGEVCFTSGGTEADNIAIMGAILALHGRPGHIVTTAVEHPAVLETVKALEEMDIRATYVPVDKSGVADPYAIADAVKETTTLVTVMHVNNEVGSVMPIEDIASLVKRKAPGALVHVDGVQAYLRMPVRMALGKIDMYTVSGHKINGPKGIGALVMRKGLNLLPLIFGGPQENGLRPGTHNVPGIVGMSAAHEGFAAPDLVSATMRDLKMKLYHGLKDADPDMLYNGPSPGQGAPHILNVTFPGVRGEVLLHALEADGVYVSTGAACSSRRKGPSHVMTALGYAGQRAEGAVRFSLSPLNTGVDVEQAVESVRRRVRELRAFRRK